MITPANFKPERVEDFVGATGRIAAQVMTKVMRLRDEPNASYKSLYFGPAGCGKTRLAELVASTLAGQSINIESLNGQSMSVDRVRQWCKDRVYRPLYGGWAVKLVNEIDSASPEAHSELLDYLDSLPPHFAFLCTTNKKLEDSNTPKPELKDCLPKRVHSRFIAYKFIPVQATETAAFVCQRWGVPYDVALRIAEANQGDVRGTFNDVERELDRMEVVA